MFGNMLMGAAGASLAGGGGGYSVGNSMVLDDGSSQNLKRTPTVNGNGNNFTISFWVKRGIIDSARQWLFVSQVGGAGVNYFAAFFVENGGTSNAAEDTLVIRNIEGSSQVYTSRVFRDPHAWYHIVIAVDTSLSESNIIKLWVNGEAETLNQDPGGGGWPTVGDAFKWNQTEPHTIGSSTGGSQGFDGYVSEFVNVDGQTLTPTSFGEYDTSGVWRPIDLTTTITTDATGVIPTSSNWDIGSTLSAGTGTLDFTSGGGTSAASTKLLTGDFTVTFTATALNDALFGVFAADERGTFNSSQDDGFMDSMTNSFWYDEGAAGGTFYFGSTSEATGVAIAAGSVVTITRSGSTISITDDASTVHTFTGTYSGTMYFLGGCRNTGSQSLNFDSISFDKVNQFGVNGFYLPFTNSASLGQDYSGTSSTTVTQKNTYNGGSEINEGDVTELAMKFVPIATATVPKIEINATSRGFSGVTVRLETDAGSGTGPSGTLVTNGEVTGITSSGAGLKTATFSTAPSVTAGTTYWIVVPNTGTWGIQHDVSGTGGALGLVQSTTYYSGRGIGHYVYQTGNIFTTSGSPTQSSDTPTNIYPTFSPLAKHPSKATLSNGNKTYVSSTTSGDVGRTACSWLLPTAGKWYWEVVVDDAGVTPSMGWRSIKDLTQKLNVNSAFLFTYFSGVSGVNELNYYGSDQTNGTSAYGNATASGFTPFVDGDVIGIAYDADNNLCWAHANGTWVDGDGTDPSATVLAEIEAGTSGSEAFNASVGSVGRDDIVFEAASRSVSNPWGYTVRFEEAEWGYSAPSGFSALNSANLYANAAPAIEDGTAHFQATAYTGNGSDGHEINQSGNSTFKPSLTWFKNRDVADSHALYDLVRGITKRLYSNSDAAESTTTHVASFDADGFTVNADTQVNGSGDGMIAWQWNGDGTSGSSNTDGSITSTVNVNDTAGFAIVKWTGTGANGTIGHGMSAAPDLIIGRNYQDAGNRWNVYHSKNTSAPETDYLTLNTTAATADDATVWNDTAPTASVFSVGTSGHINQSSKTCFAYCFRSIPGYSAFGSYEGNSSSDGSLILLDFKPAFVMAKCIDTAGTQWVMHDNARDPDNVVSGRLFADAASTESNNTWVDFGSNFFKWRLSSQDSNNSTNGTYIYAAFAENPFAGSSPATAR
jgi:hypothetical protein